MPPDQQRLSATERANLVAYLDGELTEFESQQIASKLTQSVSGRHESDSLKRTWELLDYLPRVRASDDFSTRTLSVATGQALPDDRLASLAGQAASQLVRALLFAGLALALFALSHVLVRWVWPDPTARLARELSIAEHLKEYQAVETIELLRQLDELPQFHQSSAAVPTAADPTEEGQP